MIHVITGAPCSGKTTYVNEHAQKGDVIIDYDAIARAIGADGHRPDCEIAQAAFAARRALIEWALENSESEIWIIHTSPTEKQVDEYESVGAEFVHMDTPMDECLSRCESDNRPEGTEDSIREYFNGRSEKGAPQMNTKEFNLEIKAAGEDAPSITAYASTFDREPDSYGDVVAKGAFAKTLEEWKESGLSIPLLFGHRTDDPMMNLGKVTSAVEDEKGLLIEAEFDMENPNAVKARRDVLAGTLGKMSFAFEVMNAGPVTLENGVKANELREMKLFEVSLVPIPANQHAVVVDAKDAGDVEEKAGRRNSAKDEESLGRIADLASEIITEVDSLTAVDDMPKQSDEQPEEVGRSEEPTEAKSVDEEQTEAKECETDKGSAEGSEGEEESNAPDEKSGETERPMSNEIINAIGTGAVDAEAPKSIGEFAAKSFAGIDAKQQFAKSVEYKTDPTTISGAPTIYDYDKNPVNVLKPLTIADLFGRETISGNALTYYVMADKNGATGTTAEGGKKNQIDFTYTPKTVALTKLTGFIVETDEILLDSPWLATACQDRLLNKLALTEEAQLISGNGTAPNMTGVLNTSGIGSVEYTHGGSMSADDVFKAIMKVKADSNLDADAIVINPTDYQALRLAKDSNNQYYGGGYFYGEYGQGNGAMVPSLWGLKTVISTAVSAGTCLVGAFKQAASIVSKDGLTIEATNTNGEDFVYNRVTIRAEKREALAVRIPAGFVAITEAAA